MTATLEVTGLRRRYPASVAPALCGLDLTVEAGSCVALLGPSGSGKTTALRLIAGLDSPDRGDIRVNRVSVLELAPERRGMAMVFQRPRLFPHLSVVDNVAFAARMGGASRSESRTAAMRYLELVQLGTYADRRPSTLSGGQAQRVALARGLAAEPAVLLLDEPFGALDPALRADMHQLVMEVRAVLQSTILLVTHDQQEATTLADSIAILVDGQLLQQADPQHLYNAPASLEVHRFLGGLNEIHGVGESGRHRSALGVLETRPESHAPDGPAVLLVRQEAVLVLAGDQRGADVTGQVSRVTPRGARSLLEVTTGAGLLYAEVPTGQCPRVGTPVGLMLPLGARVVVPGPAGSAPDRAATDQVFVGTNTLSGAAATSRRTPEPDRTSISGSS